MQEKHSRFKVPWRWVAIIFFAVFSCAFGFLIVAFARYSCPAIKISGLNLTNYNSVIAQRGEPHLRELIIRENARNIYALHYDGVIFYVTEGFEWIAYIDIVAERHRLRGRGRGVGVGSTRSEIYEDFQRRQRAHDFFRERPCGINILYENLKLSDDGLIFWHRGTSTYLEFEFDSNDIVIRMRFGQAF